mmetsp:Transcript_26402/g.81248  ORF Transcript_26402/g.81248 Transcript_26402/m.81248 type:complete len:89 (-) Transcript_26402:652-918(-)
MEVRIFHCKTTITITYSRDNVEAVRGAALLILIVNDVGCYAQRNRQGSLVAEADTTDSSPVLPIHNMASTARIPAPTTVTTGLSCLSR